MTRRAATASFVGGMAAVLAGAVLAHWRLTFGPLLVVAGAGWLIVSGGARPGGARPDGRPQAPPLGLELACLAAALAVGSWACFSFLDSEAGFHYDVAEFSTLLLDWTAVRTMPWPTIARLALQTPHRIVVSIAVAHWGFGLWQLRLLGAVYCWLTIGATYGVVRLLSGRAPAALAALALSGSLWNFTLSKVATWDTAVPLAATLALLLALVMLRTRLWPVLVPLLAAVLVFGIAVYEAFRLTFPVLVAVAVAALLRPQGPRRRTAGIAASMALALAFQTWFEPLFWERISGSGLLGGLTRQGLRESAANALGGLFYGSYDIYLSQSQNGLDHPLLIGAFLAGLALAAARPRRFESMVLLAWFGIPALAAILFEGQWRRASAGMPAIYVLAAWPFARGWALLAGEDGTTAGPAPARRARSRRRLAFALPASLLLALVVANAARFPSIQRQRSGGYYCPPEDLAAARAAARRGSDQRVLILTEDTKVPVLWDFIDRLDGGAGDRLVLGGNVIQVPPTAAPDALAALAELGDDPDGSSTAVFVQVAAPLAPVIEWLELQARRTPDRVTEKGIPDGAGRYRLFELAGP